MGIVGAYTAETTHRHNSKGSCIESTRFKTKGATEENLEISSDGNQSFRLEKVAERNKFGGGVWCMSHAPNRSYRNH
jgi:hypothetical protein